MDLSRISTVWIEEAKEACRIIRSQGNCFHVIPLNKKSPLYSVAAREKGFLEYPIAMCIPLMRRVESITNDELIDMKNYIYDYTHGKDPEDVQHDWMSWRGFDLYGDIDKGNAEDMDKIKINYGEQ